MSAVTMNVPKGDPFTLTYGGNVDQPQTYKPTEAGTVTVEREHLAAFLQAIPGATPASEPAQEAVANATEQAAVEAQAAPRRSAPPR